MKKRIENWWSGLFSPGSKPAGEGSAPSETAAARPDFFADDPPHDRHRMLAFLLPALQTKGFQITLDRQIRLQKLLALLPSDVPAKDLADCLCPIFASDAREQGLFHEEFLKLDFLFVEKAEPLPEPKKPTEKPENQPEIPKPEPQKSEIPKPEPPKSTPKKSPLVPDLEKCSDPPYVWKIAPDENISLETSASFGRTLTRLRSRELADALHIDWPRTLRDTSRRAGMLQIRHQRRSRPVEYLMLVERFSAEDHRALLFDRLWQMLREQEVLVERFFHDGDLRNCHNEQFPTGISLRDLRHRFANARLLVLATGHRMLNPVTGQPADWTSVLPDWRQRALLTPVSRRDWGLPEKNLAGVFALLPAAWESVEYFSELTGAEEKTRFAELPAYVQDAADWKPIVLEKPLMRSLRQHFDENMCAWIAACGLWPSLHFDLTLRLGRLFSSPENNLLTLEKFTRLCRLNWFANGYIPRSERTDLLEYLEARFPEKLRMATDTLLKLLEQSLTKIPHGSRARAEHQINLAILRLMQTENPDLETVQQLRTVIKRLDRAADITDFVLPASVGVMVEKLHLDKGIAINSDGTGSDNSQKKANLSWDYLLQAFKDKIVIKGKIASLTKGGVIVYIDGWKAFMPGSQVDVKPIRDFKPYINKEVELMVLDINETLKNVVVSTKAVIEHDASRRKKQILSGLEKGQVLEGIVKKITDFGAFIDLGGVDGLLYITDISWGRIQHPSQVLSLRQRVTVVVLDFKENKKRISLGLKQLMPHPWDMLSETVGEGSIIKGKVVNITDYGAFVEIMPGVEGLIHISEITWGNQSINAKEFFKMGQDIKARVVTIDRGDRKMSLSIKQLTADPWSEIEERFLVGSRYNGTVKNITNYGIFVELNEGVGGMVHISDLSWTKRYAHPSEFTQPGNTLEVVVLDVDNKKRQISLGHKQTLENPWDNFESVFTIGSYHEATVLKRDDKGATFQLPFGLEAFAPPKHVKKEDGQSVNAGDVVTVKVLEFNKDERRILVSHTRYVEDLKHRAEAAVRAEHSKEQYEYGGETDTVEYKIEMVVAEGGTFQMGSNEYDDEKPIHPVTLSDFEIGKYPVTQKLWREIMGNNPSHFKGDDHPIESVSWDDCQQFLKKLNQRFPDKNYRLPTEAEWEFAARGGQISKGYEYAGSDDLNEVGWFSMNSGSKTHPVGEKKANELGIHGMSGNVWEWCQDWYDNYAFRAQTNPTGTPSNSDRVRRGGSWYNSPRLCRVAYRSHVVPDVRDHNTGFRLARTY